MFLILLMHGGNVKITVMFILTRFGVFRSVFTLHSSHGFLTYLDVKGEISGLTVFSFCMCSLSCTVMAR